MKFPIAKFIFRRSLQIFRSLQRQIILFSIPISRFASQLLKKEMLCNEIIIVYNVSEGTVKPWNGWPRNLRNAIMFLKE